MPHLAVVHARFYTFGSPDFALYVRGCVRTHTYTTCGLRYALFCVDLPVVCGWLRTRSRYVAVYTVYGSTAFLTFWLFTVSDFGLPRAIYGYVAGLLLLPLPPCTATVCCYRLRLPVTTFIRGYAVGYIPAALRFRFPVRLPAARFAFTVYHLHTCCHAGSRTPTTCVHRGLRFTACVPAVLPAPWFLHILPLRFQFVATYRYLRYPVCVPHTRLVGLRLRLVTGSHVHARFVWFGCLRTRGYAFGLGLVLGCCRFGSPRYRCLRVRGYAVVPAGYHCCRFACLRFTFTTPRLPRITVYIRHTTCRVYGLVVTAPAHVCYIYSSPVTHSSAGCYLRLRSRCHTLPFGYTGLPVVIRLITF